MLETLGVNLAVLGRVALDILEEVITTQLIGGAVLASEGQFVGVNALGRGLVATVVHGLTLLGLHVVA